MKRNKLAYDLDVERSNYLVVDFKFFHKKGERSGAMFFDVSRTLKQSVTLVLDFF